MTLALAVIILWLFVAAVAAFSAGLCQIDDPDISTLIAFWPVALGVAVVVLPMLLVTIAGIWIYHAGRTVSERFTGEST